MTNGKLFRETYVSHEKVEGSGCRYWMESMTGSVKNHFRYTDSELRQVFKGLAADGAYIKNKAASHLSDILSIPEDFSDQLCVWDYCHKLERADFHARKANPWVNKADDERKAIVKRSEVGKCAE